MSSSFVVVAGVLFATVVFEFFLTSANVSWFVQLEWIYLVAMYTSIFVGSGNARQLIISGACTGKTSFSNASAFLCPFLRFGNPFCCESFGHLDSRKIDWYMISGSPECSGFW